MPRQLAALVFAFVLLSALTCAVTAQSPLQPAAPPAPATAQPASPATAPPVVAAPVPSLVEKNSDLTYRIGPGDVLDIRVFGRPEMTREVRVDTFGRIRLPFLDEMMAACLTEAELSAAISEKYKKYLREPQIDVMIKEYRSQPVAVIGAVFQPGRFQLQRRVRLLELVTFAGGPNARAGNTIHIIHSSDHDYCTLNKEPNNKTTATSASTNASGNTVASAAAELDKAEPSDSLLPQLSAIKLRDLLDGAASANPFVQPGDIISIPEADQIFVTGAVVRPGAYPLNVRLTLTQAISLAGGVNTEGARNRVRLVRVEPGSEKRTEKVYNVDDILKRKTEDVVLRSNDILEVPSSTMRIASRNALGVGVGMLSSLPFFIVR